MYGPVKVGFLYTEVRKHESERSIKTSRNGRELLVYNSPVNFKVGFNWLS